MSIENTISEKICEINDNTRKIAIIKNKFDFNKSWLSILKNTLAFCILVLFILFLEVSSFNFFQMSRTDYVFATVFFSFLVIIVFLIFRIKILSNETNDIKEKLRNSIKIKLENENEILELKSCNGYR